MKHALYTAHTCLKHLMENKLFVTAISLGSIATMLINFNGNQALFACGTALGCVTLIYVALINHEREQYRISNISTTQATDKNILNETMKFLSKVFDKSLPTTSSERGLKID